MRKIDKLSIWNSKVKINLGLNYLPFFLAAMQQPIDLPDHLLISIEQYLRTHPTMTLSTLVEQALTQKLISESITLPTSEQIEQFMALSGTIKTASHHSDEHAEDEVA
jgi:hypothetical protein